VVDPAEGLTVREPAAACLAPRRFLQQTGAVRRLHLLLGFLLLSTLAACSGSPGPGPQPLTPTDSKGWGAISLNGVETRVRWSDGDSFKFKDGPHEGSGVRLVGFNTLESYGPVHRWGKWTAEELYSIAASSKDYAASRVWNCSTSGDKDGYGRLLVDCPDAAEALILAGHAHAFSMEGESSPDLQRAQQKAQRTGRGIWKKGVPDLVVTSLHSAAEGKGDRKGYNRRVNASSGAPMVRNHTENYKVCQEVCEGGSSGSCLVYVPYAQRYRSKPDCLK